jgi:hypothetical protein
MSHLNQAIATKIPNTSPDFHTGSTRNLSKIKQFDTGTLFALSPKNVILAKTGIHGDCVMDSRLRGSDEIG